MKPTQKQAAKDLFFSTAKSRKEIAQQLAIDEKTLYRWIKKEAWDEHKKAAHAAPAIIVDNLCYMLVELQDHIAQRPIGHRFPTAQEADTMRKLINSITKMRDYTSVGSNMQMMVDFTTYIGADQQFCTQLQAYAEKYFTARKANPRYNNSFGFEAEQSPEATEAELNEIRENIMADINATPQTYEEYLAENQVDETEIECTEITGSHFAIQPGIPVANTSETPVNTAFHAPSHTPSNLPASGKSGNSAQSLPSKPKRPAFINRHKKQSRNSKNTNIYPPSSGLAA